MYICMTLHYTYLKITGNSRMIIKSPILFFPFCCPLNVFIYSVIVFITCISLLCLHYLNTILCYFHVLFAIIFLCAVSLPKSDLWKYFIKTFEDGRCNICQKNIKTKLLKLKEAPQIYVSI